VTTTWWPKKTWLPVLKKLEIREVLRHATHVHFLGPHEGDEPEGDRRILTSSHSRSAVVDTLVADAEREPISADSDGLEALARLQKTVTTFAHVHAILVCLRARAEDLRNARSDTQ
jgi:hypothetical protein